MTIPRGHAVMLALGIVVLFDVLRVFLPSLITLFGRAGETPAELMGLYAAAWFILPFLALLSKPRHALVAGAAGLVAARLLLQAGVSQLYVSSAGVTAGLILLYGCACTVPRRAVPVGIMGGIALSSLVHLLLDGMDLAWQEGPLPWAATLALCLALFLALLSAPRTEEGAPAPARIWFLFGPTLLLAGMAATSWAKPEQGPEPLGTLALSWGLLALTLVAATAAALGPATAPLIELGLGIALIAITVVSYLPGSGVPGLSIGFLGSMLAAAGSGPAGRRQGPALLGGGLVFLVGVFAYYAAYDLDLGVPNAVVPVAVSVLVAAVAVVPRLVRDPPVQLSARRRTVPAAAAVALVLVPMVVAVAWQPVPAVAAKRSDDVTLIAYNIRMGFGLDGRLSLDRIASWAAAQRPDIVLLSEVDRGWLLNGGHDDLDRIARGLGMRHYFAPAADNVWGDALLTNLPVKSVRSYELGRHDHPTGAQAQAVVVEVNGRELGVVNTHLQAPTGQAPEVAAIVRDLAASRPVILAGDLNTTPADPEMGVLLAAGLSDPLKALGDPPTSPADRPVKRIDHVLISAGLTAVSAQVPRLPYSDHLPVLTTLRLTSVDQEG
ncbi:endonuclease/exonuclease/phosphatase family protein [Nonomuraea fuscirosea]|uniref:endonuclease/exonuclease/phosphatase family protein n=1 Tax=Nonomuraea fuscirosea TaxID=1291556 RepID=UPI002DD877BF|nr:endonuclease/exonuclease/phosphatase family protein [Nonomuraea fuscirosea]WSA49342.1 endonuclease/exonuclease/phosphatase family protein [Nonomuraea fuscirosea]